MNIRFTDEMNPRNAAGVIDVLRAPRLWIPTVADYGARHGEWLGKVEHGLIDGTRHALHARVGRQSVGAIVYRPNESDLRIIDIRNISIHPDVKGRRFGTFMLRNIEMLAQEQYADVERFRIDTKATNTEMLSFLSEQGYGLTSVSDLYGDGKPDVVLEKSLI